MTETESNPPATDPVTETGDGGDDSSEAPSSPEEVAPASGEPADIDPSELTE